MFDEQTEALCEELGLEIAFPSAKLRNEIDDKIMTTRIAARAGIDNVPNVLTPVKDYADLRRVAKHLGEQLVIQTAYGDSGHTTFFVSNEAEFDEHAEEITAAPEVKVMKRIRCRGAAQEACVTRHGTIVGTLMTELVGFGELTPYKGGWCGNEVLPDSFTADVRDEARAMTAAFGEELKKMRYTLVIRYLLQVCTTTEEAVAVLRRVPCHMAYTVTVVDAHSHSATVFVSLDRPAQVTANLAATNHQVAVEWPEHALSTCSVERLAEVTNAAADSTTGPDAFVARFLEPTVWSTQYAKGAGTLYAACYAPHAQSLTMLWPKQRWTFPVSGFEPGSLTIKLA
ncbi:MAG: hypothetical protein ACI855_004983 [Myxococcota bacterium]|jgi:hypothetical protein